jgi:hypothetical protein
MVIPLSQRGFNYGCSINHSPSVRGHLRPLDYYFGSSDFMRPWLLGYVGADMGAGGNTSNLRGFQLPYGKSKGAIKWH